MTAVWAGVDHKRRICTPCSYGDGVLYESVAEMTRARKLMRIANGGQRSPRPGKIQFHTWDEYDVYVGEKV